MLIFGEFAQLANDDNCDAENLLVLFANLFIILVYALNTGIGCKGGQTSIRHISYRHSNMLSISLIDVKASFDLIGQSFCCLLQGMFYIFNNQQTRLLKTD